MRDEVEELIEQLCTRPGGAYAGFHTLEPGVLAGEKCPLICFHIARDGGRAVYTARVASSGTEVRDEAENVGGRYPKLTRDRVFG
jgi:hypothetical protein